MTYDVIITCAKGIPDLLAQELRDLGMPALQQGPASVETRTDLAGLYRLNLHLRTAHRVLVRLKEFRCTHPDALYRNIVGLPWEDWLGPGSYFNVHNAVSTPCINDSRFPSLKVKDAIVDRVRDRTGARPDCGPGHDGASVFLYWKNNEAAIYLDFSGVPLSRRGYRLQGGPAPMQEALAAAVILATGWDKSVPLLNPMCGSGTLAIEAAWIAKRRAPGLLREHFACQALRDFDEELWRAECDAARAQELPDGDIPKILASDHDSRCMDPALQNALRADVVRQIEFETCDYTDTDLSGEPGWIVMNPEYGVRLGQEEDLIPHYRSIGDWLKQEASGWKAAVFTGSLPLSRNVGLKPYQRLEMYNGKLEARLLLFEMFAGHWREKNPSDSSEPTNS